jgi:hypothetical protein
MTTHAQLTSGIAITSSAVRASRAQVIAGRVLSGIAVLFLLFDGVAKLIQPQPVIEGSKQLGYPPDTIFGIGVVLLTCVAIHLIPQTKVLGAALVTAYLGGAVATHVRVGSPLLTHVLFPTYVAALVWGGLILREPLLRVILPSWRRA